MRFCATKMEDVDVQLFDHTDQLPSTWNELLPINHFLRTENLRHSEHSYFQDLQFLYAVISLEKKVVGLAYFQLLSIQPNHLDSASFNMAQQIGWKLFTNVFRPKLLVAGHLFRHDIDSFFCAAALTAFEAYKIYDATIQTVLKRHCAHAVLVKDLPQPLVAYFQHYAPQYLLLRNDILMQMPINPKWETTADYEQTLKHKYAQRYRKIRKQWEQLTIKELNKEEVEQHKAEIFQLYQQVTQKQQVRLGYISEAYIPLLKKEFEDDFHVWLAFDATEPIAFFSAWTKEDVFDMFYIGFDYAKNERFQLYFNILYFSVEQAILHRKKQLVLGRTALEAKARIGCKPVYLSTFLFIKNTLVRNIVLRIQQSVVTGEGEWENRHPFKPNA